MAPDNRARHRSPWSDWAVQGGRWYRQRETAEGEYEVQDGGEATGDSTQYCSQDNFTTDPVGALTQQVAVSTLNEGSELNVPPPQAVITTRNPNRKVEKFDKNYREHHQREFTRGKVLKILWSEPTGSGTEGDTEYSVRKGRYGELFHEKVRRFVIIDARAGHCICLPIMSYGGRGTTKPGVHAEDHAVIHTTSQPVYLEGEDRMTKAPIRVKPITPQHKLEKASRLNYAKVYTIEYNVKVWFVGSIRPEYEVTLVATYNAVHPPLQSQYSPISQAVAATSAAVGPSLYSAQYSQYTPAPFPAGSSINSPSGWPVASSVPPGSFSGVATSHYGPVQQASYQGGNVPAGYESSNYQQTSSYQSNAQQEPYYPQEEDLYEDN